MLPFFNMSPFSINSATTCAKNSFSLSWPEPARQSFPTVIFVSSWLYFTILCGIVHSCGITLEIILICTVKYTSFIMAR